MRVTLNGRQTTPVTFNTVPCNIGQLQWTPTVQGQQLGQSRSSVMTCVSQPNTLIVCTLVMLCLVGAMVLNVAGTIIYLR